MSRKPFFMFFADDYLAGTRHLDPEHRGIFMDCIAIQWSMQDGLPLDEKKLSKRLGLDIRVCRKAVVTLFDDGKLVVFDGKIWNPRIATEMGISIEEPGELPPNFRKTYPKRKPKVPQKFQESLPKVSENSEQKANEINASKNPIPEPYPEPYPEEEIQASQQSDSVTETQAVSDNPLAGLNGATDLVIADLAKWINPAFPDTMTAKGSLRTAIGIHGAPIVKQAYGELKAQMDSGDLIARPLIVLDKICQRIKRDGPGCRPNTRQNQQDKVAAAIAAAKQGAHGHA